MRWLGGLLLLLLPIDGAIAADRTLEAGAYVIRYRLELPHVERWAVDKTDTACLAGMPSAGPIQQATVAAPSCAQAEVAAKVAVLSDLGAAIAFLESRQLAGVLITTAGEAWTAGPWR